MINIFEQGTYIFKGYIHTIMTLLTNRALAQLLEYV